MKKTLSLLLVLCSSYITATAQSSIPNPSFEIWNSSAYEDPTNYPETSNEDAFGETKLFNVVKTTDSYSGSYAVKLTTIAKEQNNIGGILCNGTNINGPDPNLWKSGIPYNQRPTGIKGYYQYNVATADSALIGVVFKKSGVILSFSIFKIGGIHSSYTPFEFSFPSFTQDPDSLIFIAVSSDLVSGNGVPGSSLTLDNVSFTGVASQPALLNGDFEEWTPQHTPYIPAVWNTNRMGLSRSTDKYDGAYALELTTTKEENDKGETNIVNGWAQLGSWNEEKQIYENGFPYNKPNDILTFYYKYAPNTPGDKANVGINLQKNSANVGGSWMELEATDTYKYVEMPFSCMESPDEAIISFQANRWETLSLSSVGSVLKVDKVAFKSESTNIPENKAGNGIASFRPMPLVSSGTLEISPLLNLSNMKMNIYNTAGVLVRTTPITAYQTTINKENLVPGTYLYEIIKENARIFRDKLTVK